MRDMRVCVYVIAGDKAKADELVGLFPSTYMSDAQHPQRWHTVHLT